MSPPDGSSRHNTQAPRVVAHRGYAMLYPENTLESLEAALSAGVGFVEFDVQISADGIPVLLHDEDLCRTAGTPGRVMELSAAALTETEVNERERLGDQFSGIKVPTLAAAMDLLDAWPAAKAFVELKKESLDYHGTAEMVQAVMDVIRNNLDQCIVISFSEQAVTMARRLGAKQIAWVISRWNEEQRRTAEELQPEYLFCNHEKLPAEPEPLWSGPWHWVPYEIETAEHALELASRGVGFVESMAVGDLLAHPRIKEAQHT